MLSETERRQLRKMARAATLQKLGGSRPRELAANEPAAKAARPAVPNVAAMRAELDAMSSRMAELSALVRVASASDPFSKSAAAQELALERLKRFNRARGAR